MNVDGISAFFFKNESSPRGGDKPASFVVHDSPDNQVFRLSNVVFYDYFERFDRLADAYRNRGFGFVFESYRRRGQIVNVYELL